MLPHIRSVKMLDSAVQTLQEQYEAIELVKVDVKELQTAKSATAAGIPESKTYLWYRKQFNHGVVQQSWFSASLQKN